MSQELKTLKISKQGGKLRLIQNPPSPLLRSSKNEKKTCKSIVYMFFFHHGRKSY
jgi:hypothetical protein